MFDKLPRDQGLRVVRFDNRDWQPAMYVDGEFVDAYGMPLDSGRISSWRAPNGTPHNTAVANGRSTQVTRPTPRLN